MAAIDLIGRLEMAPTDQRQALCDEVLAERRRRIQPFVRPRNEFARDYFSTPELLIAVDVALSLGRPLLLTGEPGSGKTLAAAWIAERLGLTDNYLEFQVHSDSRAQDLRYEFDAVSWFRESQLAVSSGKPVPNKRDFLTPRALGIAFGWLDNRAMAVAPSRPYVVLIDEIDKAPRDFPNDLLLEIDQMRFSIEETGETVGPPTERPIIVITSNAERRLPDPFLRRCIVHHIELTPATVLEILMRRMTEQGQGNTELVRTAQEFWTNLRQFVLDRKPTIAEYWQWLALAIQHGDLERSDLISCLVRQGSEIRMLPFIDTLFSAQDLTRVAGPPP